MSNSMISNFQSAFLLVGFIAVWGIGTRLCVEIVRDSFHILSHRVPFLAKHHNWHHRVFKRDMSQVSSSLYEQSQWHHDVPESVVMLLTALSVFAASFLVSGFSYASIGSLLCLLFTMHSLLMAILRGFGYQWAIQLDTNHSAPERVAPPSKWGVNWSYHQRHHFENPNAYFSGIFTFVDRAIGTALSLKGKTVVITGASGSLGRSLITQLIREKAKVIALTSSCTSSIEVEVDGETEQIETVFWSADDISSLDDVLKSADVLILNHGVNLRGRAEKAVLDSINVNALSAYTLLERFTSTVQSPFDIARKEAWVITSEAEVASASSPLYEISKRLLGQLVTLKRLDSPCIIRKVVPGCFISQMSPQARITSDWMAQKIIKGVKRDGRNIVISPHQPWIYLYYPVHEWLTSIYAQRWSKSTAEIEKSVSGNASQVASHIGT